MLGLPVFSNYKVNLQNPREFTHAWAMQAVRDLRNLAECLYNRATEPTPQPHSQSNLPDWIAKLRERFEILKTQQDRFDFNYFTASRKSVKVFGKSYANYHVAVQRILFATVCNVFYDAFSKRLSPNAAEQDLAKLDAVYVERITDDFRRITNHRLEKVAARFEDLYGDLENELGRCVRSASLASSKLESSAWPSPRGWDFESGKASYDGKVFEVVGIEWRLLKKLATTPGPLTRDELYEAGWEHEQDPSPDTLRSHLTNIRKLLRRKLDIKDEKYDPIPNADRTSQSAWQLHLDLRTS